MSTLPGVQPREAVWLNGRAYPVMGPVTMQRVDVTPFAGKISAGDPKYGDFTVASTLVMRDWRAGLGLQYARPDKPGRYWESTLDTRFPYQTVLDPKVTNSASTWGPIWGTSISEIGGVIVACDGSTTDSIRYYNGTWNSGTGLGSAGLVVYRRLVRYTPPGGVLTLYAFAAYANRYAYSTNGIAWTTVNLSAGDALGETLIDACVYDAKLVAVGATGNVFFSIGPNNATNGGWDLATEDGAVPDSTTRIVTYLNRAGEPAVYVCGTQGVWVVDLYSGAVSQVLDLAGSKSDYNGIGACVHAAALHIPTVRGVFRLDATGVAANLGPNAPREDGFPGVGQSGITGHPGYSGQVVMLQSDGPTLYALYSSAMGASSNVGGGAILAYDDMGWHVLHTLRKSDLTPETLTDRGTFYKSPTRASAPQYARFWVGTYRSNSSITYALNYFEIPMAVENSLLDSAYTYEASGSLVTPYFDAEFAEVPKGAYELHVNYRLKDVDNAIVVEYQINNDLGSSWTALGTIGAGGGQAATDLANAVRIFTFGSDAQGIAFQNIRFKFTLTRDAGLTTTTPVLLYAILKLIPRPATKYSFSFVVDLGEEALADAGLDFPTCRAALDACRDSIPLLDFYEFDPRLGAPRWQVLLANKQEMTQWADARRLGRVTVNLTQVV